MASSLAVLLVAFAAPLASATDGDKKPSNAAEEFASLKDSYEKAVAEHQEKLKAAKKEDLSALLAEQQVLPDAE